MNARPILFNADMVRALLDGSKGQTRRPINLNRLPVDFIGGKGDDVNNPENWGYEDPNGEWALLKCQNPESGYSYQIPSLFGQIGDLLYVRETFWNYGGHDSHHGFCRSKKVAYCATDDEPKDGLTLYKEWRKTPSIHMPRWASRLTLKITDIRVERVQHITQNDAVAEGWPGCIPNIISPNSWYADLWNSLYNNWNDNPWVWVVEFEVIKQNVDSLEE